MCTLFSYCQVLIFLFSLEETHSLFSSVSASLRRIPSHLSYQTRSVCLITPFFRLCLSGVLLAVSSCAFIFRFPRAILFPSLKAVLVTVACGSSGSTGSPHEVLPDFRARDSHFMLPVLSLLSVLSYTPNGRFERSVCCFLFHVAELGRWVSLFLFPFFFVRIAMVEFSSRCIYLWISVWRGFIRCVKFDDFRVFMARERRSIFSSLHWIVLGINMFNLSSWE